MGLNAHCRVKFLCADFRLRFLRLSTIKKCPHMLKSDHRGLRNSKVKLMWWWVSRWYEMIAETVQILTEFICWFIALLKSLLSLKSDLVSQTNLKRLQFGPQKCLKLHVGRKCQTCPELPIDTWKLERSSEEFTSVMEGHRGTGAHHGGG